MALSDSMNAQEVYLLPLTDKGAPQVPKGYIYLPPPSDPPYIVRFAIEGTSSIFQRYHFREYNWVLRLSRSLQILIFPEIKASPRFQSDPQD